MFITLEYDFFNHDNSDLTEVWTDWKKNSNVEGYLGNESATKTKTYSRCAVIMWPAANEMNVILRTSAGIEGGLSVLENTFRLYRLSSSSTSITGSTGSVDVALSLKRTKEDVVKACRELLKYWQDHNKPGENIAQREARVRNVIRELNEPSLLDELEKIKSNSKPSSGLKRDATSSSSVQTSMSMSTSTSTSSPTSSYSPSMKRPKHDVIVIDD